MSRVYLAKISKSFSGVAAVGQCERWHEAPGQVHRDTQPYICPLIGNLKVVEPETNTV